MTVSRIYLPREMEVNDTCELTHENRQYVMCVLRMRKGDNILLFDGMGREYDAIITGCDHERVIVEITRKEIIHGDTVHITLAQSLPKAKKMDSIIEKACELGVDKIIPFASARSIPQMPPEKAFLKQVRWQKIALEAARKSHANSIPEIVNVLTFEEMLREAHSGTRKIIFWEEETKRGLRQVLQCAENKDNQGFFLVIGPEGGFSGEEVALAESRGFVSVTLGRQVLKVETASLAILSVIQYEKGALGKTKEE